MINLRKKLQKSKIIKTFKALAMLFLWLFVIGAIMLLSLFLYLQRTLPDPESIATRKVVESTKIYDHKGLDLRGIARALFKDIINLGVSQGGSTITQQLIKKALLGDERTISRKIKEAVLAIEIEKKFTKDQIFWMYLNQIPYGSNAYGIESAAKEFFGKKASQLTA